MKSLLGLGVVLSFLVADASAGCLGCGNQGAQCSPVQCDQTHLWSGFSPSQVTYSPNCWSGGCGNGIFNGAGIGLLDRIKCHIQNGGCGIACNGTCPDLGWDSMGSCCGGPGLGGYGGYSLASFHGMSYAGPRLMGNSRGGCCPKPSCFAGPCGFGGGGPVIGGGCCVDSCGGCGLGCHSFQTGWLAGLMERLRGHCCAGAYSCGSLDPCGTLGSCNAFPAGNLGLNFGVANYGDCGCDGGCHSGSCGVSGGCGNGGIISGGYIQGGSAGGAGCGNGAVGTPTPVPSLEPQPTSHPSAKNVQYPSTETSAFLQGTKPGLFRSAKKGPMRKKSTSDYFSVTR